MYEAAIGASLGWRSMSYDWRDMALYALSVGADENDLMYTYEKDMKALPTFGVLPVFSNINCTPKRPDAYSGFFLARDVMEKELNRKIDGALHTWHEITILRPFYPIDGTMVYDQIIKQIYEWGEKGVMVELEIPVYDLAGRLLCKNRSLCALPAGPGAGGVPMINTKVPFPDREPDKKAESYLSKTQNVLYRLTGDTGAPHIDPEVAGRYADRVFLHGLCTYGFACRMAIKELIPGEPERMKRFAAQMRSMAYPDTPIELRLWLEKEDRAYFKLIDQNTGKALLDHGVIEWEG
jgi:Acyl dehydratase